MDPKTRILARRSAFIAAALVAASCEPPPPKVCLSVEYIDAGRTVDNTADNTAPDASTDGPQSKP